MLQSNLTLEEGTDKLSQNVDN